MSSYRRFISYMHQYQNDKKGQNCGFIKIEIKNGQCSLFFQLKKVPAADSFSIAFFVRETNTISLIPIWSGSCPGGMFNQRFITDSLHLFNTNYSFDQCAGILLIYQNRTLCGSCWDKIGKIPPKLPAAKAITTTGNEPSSHENPSPDEEPSACEIPSTDKEPSTCEIPSTDEEPSTCEIPSTDEEPSSFENPSSNEESSPKQTPTFDELWNSLQKKYPPLDPFEEGGIVEGIKISPSDLAYLTFLPFDLGANRFLLHGYKNYKHLLLGRMEGQNRYILGIPGVFDSQEQFMAKMFGFPCFKPIRSFLKPSGQFGYWFRCIH